MSVETDARARFEAFFRKRSEHPDSVRITDVQSITGGYSRQMTRVWVEDNGETRGYIVRQDPPPGQAIIDTDRAVEWDVVSGLHSSGKIPMPAPLWFDPNGEELGSPAIVIEMVDGDTFITATRKLDPGDLAPWAVRFAEAAGAIAAFPAEEAPGSLARPASWDDYIDARINYWVEGEQRHCDRDPFMRMIAAHLKRHRPAPVPLGLVHGDFQIGNVLCASGTGPDLLIDWELTHIGDPREDLGWCMMASVTQPPDLVGADEDAFYRRYRELSGYTEEQVNPAVIDWFTLLASATVYISVLEQLAALANGQTTGITVAYMSPAVSGMQDVFLTTLKRHARADREARK